MLWRVVGGWRRMCCELLPWWEWRRCRRATVVDTTGAWPCRRGDPMRSREASISWKVLGSFRQRRSRWRCGLVWAFLLCPTCGLWILHRVCLHPMFCRKGSVCGRWRRDTIRVRVERGAWCSSVASLVGQPCRLRRTSSSCTWSPRASLSAPRPSIFHLGLVSVHLLVQRVFHSRGPLTFLPVFIRAGNRMEYRISFGPRYATVSLSANPPSWSSSQYATLLIASENWDQVRVRYPSFSQFALG